MWWDRQIYLVVIVRRLVGRNTGTILLNVSHFCDMEMKNCRKWAKDFAIRILKSKVEKFVLFYALIEKVTINNTKSNTINNANKLVPL